MIAIILLVSVIGASCSSDSTTDAASDLADAPTTTAAAESTTTAAAGTEPEEPEVEEPEGRDFTAVTETVEAFVESRGLEGVAEWAVGNPAITPAQLISNSSGLVGLGPNLGTN